MQTSAKPLLSVRNLRTSFFQDEGTTKAVDGATFDVMSHLSQTADGALLTINEDHSVLFAGVQVSALNAGDFVLI